MARDPAELQEIAWAMIDEALTAGTMTLQNDSGKPIKLGSQDIVRIAQWLATSKVKKPAPVQTPEDFIMKETTGGDDADAET